MRPISSSLVWHRVLLGTVLACLLSAGALRASDARTEAGPTAPTPDASVTWSNVAINRGADGAISVLLESDILRLEYGPDIRPGHTTVYKALALVHKPTGQKIGPFDSRYSPTRTEMLTLRHAEQLPARSADEVTVRLYFLTRVLDVTLLRGTTFARFDYTFINGTRHTYDQVALPGVPEHTYFFSGQEAYTKHMGWSHESKKGAYAVYPFSFHRHDWAGRRYLDHRGWLIVGAGTAGRLGYGAVLPMERLQWLKLMNSSGGLERMMNADTATVYYYLVPDFTPERGRRMGEAFVDALPAAKS